MKYSRPLEQIQHEAWEVLHDYFINTTKADPDSYGFCWVEAFDYGWRLQLLDLTEDEWAVFKKKCRVKFTADSKKLRSASFFSSIRGVGTAIMNTSDSTGSLLTLKFLLTFSILYSFFTSSSSEKQTPFFNDEIFVSEMSTPVT